MVVSSTENIPTRVYAKLVCWLNKYLCRHQPLLDLCAWWFVVHQGESIVEAKYTANFILWCVFFVCIELLIIYMACSPQKIYMACCVHFTWVVEALASSLFLQIKGEKALFPEHVPVFRGWIHYYSLPGIHYTKCLLYQYRFFKS